MTPEEIEENPAAYMFSNFDHLFWIRVRYWYKPWTWFGPSHEWRGKR